MSTVSENMLALYMTLYADEATCLSSLGQSASHGQESIHFCHRGFVRAACAVIEGATYCMKYAAFITFNESGLYLSGAQIAMLLEKSYGIDKKGEAKEGNAHISIRQSIPFAFNMYARAHGTEYVIAKDRGWQNFNLALEIRDRLMHPKKIDDLSVPDGETTIVADASIWFGRHIVALLKCCNISIADKIQDFENQLNEIERLHASVV
jgi:hypothetical protein